MKHIWMLGIPYRIIYKKKIKTDPGYIIRSFTEQPECDIIILDKGNNRYKVSAIFYEILGIISRKFEMNLDVQKLRSLEASLTQVFFDNKNSSLFNVDIPIEKSIHILGIDYKIKITKNLKGKKGKGYIVYGNSSHPECTIGILKGGNALFSRGTLLHEVVEVINHRLALKLKHIEIICLESVLLQVIIDNPDLVKLIKD